MKVIHLLSGLRGGGAEHFVLDLCIQSINDSKVEMKVLALSSIDDIAYKFHETGADLLLSVVKDSGQRKRTVFRSFTLLLRQRNVDILHAHMFHACMVACVYKIFRPSARIIFTLHNNYVPEWHRKYLLFLAKPFRSKDIIFPGTKPQWYQKKNAVVIPNGIDVSKFAHPDVVKPPVFTFAFIGRIEEQKNPLYLVELAGSLRHDYTFCIRIAGEGSLTTKLRQLIHHRDLQNYFELAGFQHDIPRLLSQCHCLLLPSAWEGMPLVMLEAGAAGVPVIATPVGSVPAILNSSNGYVGELDKFPGMLREVMGNYGDALIRARRLMTDITINFTIEKSYRQHLETYRHI